MVRDGPGGPDGESVAVPMPEGLVLVIAISYVGPLFNLVESYRLVGQTETELTEVEAENRQLERRTKHLTSDSVLEREARRQGMSFPAEQPYVVDGVGR